MTARDNIDADYECSAAVWIARKLLLPVSDGMN